jgi:imidazoleglycerol-phosphate dehydratase
MPRRAKIKRKTSETDITLEVDLDGSGKSSVSTGIPFFDHMLTLLSRHGLFDLRLTAKGDIEVDFHHTVEDVGLALGEAIKKALGDKKSIRRYGSSHVPMMDSLATVVLDLSGRPNLIFTLPTTMRGGGGFKLYLAEKKGIFGISHTTEFLKALSNSSDMDLHVTLEYGGDLHHSIEAIFKALARALREATTVDRRIKGVLSTKGRL